MIVSFGVAAKRLYLSAKKFEFSQFVLIVEAFKILLYMFYTFVLMDQVYLIMIQMLQTTIQFIITLSFLDKTLAVQNRDETCSKRVKYLIVSLFSVIMIASIISTFFVGRRTCSHTVLGREWIFLIILSFIQTIIILWSMWVLTGKRRDHIRTVSAERASVNSDQEFLKETSRNSDQNLPARKSNSS